MREVPFPPGVEYTNMMSSFKNISDEPVVLEHVTLVRSQGFASVATLVRVDAAPRPEDGDLIPLGRFNVDPPSWFEGGRCGTQPTERWEDHRVEPGLSVALAIHIRTQVPGTYGFKGVRIVYRQGDGSFHQTVPFELEGAVAVDAEAEPEPEQLRCVGNGVRLLPGWDERP